MIQFTVVLKNIIRERGIWGPLSKTNAQYNLYLISPEKMEGTQIFTYKDYSSDGSISLRDKNVTRKVTFVKSKHSDHPSLKLYLGL